MKSQPNVVVLLGAGASKAVNSSMPLTDELGAEATRRVPSSDGVPHSSFPGWFEALLSRLAEDQPDLNEAQNLRNRGLFRDLASAVTTIINEREADALSQPMPSWLSELCVVWHERQATLITFNYDTLIERAASTVGIYDWDTKHYIRGDDVINRLPPHPPGPSRFGPPPMPTSMRLLKLHGSVAWYAAPSDETGATLARRSVNWWAPPEAVAPDELRREFPGREPFIVPPASAKSSFYRNPVLRQLWQDAGDALSYADEIHLLGYSLPAADLVTRGMLVDRSASHALWRIADINPKGLGQQLSRIGQTVDTEFDSVESYTTRETERLATEAMSVLTEEVLGTPSDMPVILSWGAAPTFALDPSIHPNGVMSTTGAPMSLGQLVNGLSSRPHLTAGALRDFLENSRIAAGLRVRLGDSDASIIGSTNVTESMTDVPRPVIAIRCSHARPNQG